MVTATGGGLFGMQLVLKVFHRISDDTRRRAFLDEAEILSKLSHPAIIRIFDEGEFEAKGHKYPFAIVEYLPGTARHLLVSKQLDRLSAVRIVMNCLSALTALHGLANPICHRDIKPENILISPTCAKLADFGLARVTARDPLTNDDDADDGSDKDLSQWPGMPRRYRTPEQVQRAKERKMGMRPTVEVTSAADIYQLGTVFYELLTGFNPQRPPDPSEILAPIKLDIRTLHGAQGNEGIPCMNPRSSAGARGV